MTPSRPGPYDRALAMIRPLVEGTDLTLEELAEMLAGVAPWTLRIARPSPDRADEALRAVAVLGSGNRPS